MFDEGFARGHPLAAHGQSQGDGRQESFRDVGDDDADAEHRAAQKSQTHADADGKKHEAHGDGQAGHDVRHLHDFLLERAEPGLDGRRQMRNLAEFSAEAGRKDDGLAMA